MGLFSKAKIISFPLFAQTFPDIDVILDLGLPISVQSEISPRPLGFLMALDLSKSALSIPAGPTPLLPATVHIPNNMNATTKADEIVTKKPASSEMKENSIKTQLLWCNSPPPVSSSLSLSFKAHTHKTRVSANYVFLFTECVIGKQRNKLI